MKIHGKRSMAICMYVIVTWKCITDFSSILGLENISVGRLRDYLNLTKMKYFVAVIKPKRTR
jgi:hypothetical protein